MLVEIWSDLICPWCGLGNHRLEKALVRLGHEEAVELVHHSFQLDERAPEGETKTVREMLRGKFRASEAQLEAMTRHVEELARADGLSPYYVLENRVGNTSLAHEFALWATEQGAGNAAWKLLYKKYFGEASSIFDRDSLAALAPELALSSESAREALSSRSYASKVRADGREAQALGVHGVPFILIDRRYKIEGAQSVDLMVRALESAWSSRRPTSDATPARAARDVESPQTTEPGG